MVYKVRKATDGWRWRLRTGNNKITAESGEAYQKKEDCLAAIELAKNSKTAVVEDE